MKRLLAQGCAPRSGLESTSGNCFLAGHTGFFQTMKQQLGIGVSQRQVDLQDQPKSAGQSSTSPAHLTASLVVVRMRTTSHCPITKAVQLFRCCNDDGRGDDMPDQMSTKLKGGALEGLPDCRGPRPAGPAARQCAQGRRPCRWRHPQQPRGRCLAWTTGDQTRSQIP